MKAIIIPDLHIKSSEPHLYGLREFFKWIKENYDDHVIIQAGDLFDSSSVHHTIVDEFLGKILTTGKEWHIIEGNHDKSKIKGSILKPLNHHNNIHIYNMKTEVDIKGITFLFLPHIHNAKEEYEQIKWKGNFGVFHVTNKEDAFGDEGIDTSNIDAIQFFGHTHTYHKINDRKIVMGVPVCTRNLEVNNYIIEINDDKYELIKTPDFFNYVNIDYGTEIDNTHNIYNVKNAPSVSSVYDKYKGFHIRREGIEVLRTEKTDQEELDKEQFDAGNILFKYNYFCKEKNLPKEVIEMGNKYLSKRI